MRIGPGKSEQVGASLNDTCGRGARAAIVFLHKIAHRKVPSSVRVGEEFNWLAGAFFDLSLACGDFVLCQLSRQVCQDRVADTVCAETKPLVNEFNSLLPVQQRFLSNRERLAGPAVLPAAIPGRQKYYRWQAQTTEHGRSGRVKVTKAIVKGQNNGSLRKGLSLRQYGDDFVQRGYSNVL